MPSISIAHSIALKTMPIVHPASLRRDALTPSIRDTLSDTTYVVSES